MSWFPGINGRPGIVTADWLMTRGNTISNGSEYVTKIQAAKNILLTPTADAKASELVADIARLGQALRGGVVQAELPGVGAAPPTLFANPEPPAAPQGGLSEAARPLAESVSSGSGFIPRNPADAVAMVPSAERAAAADSARVAAAAAAAAAQPEAGPGARGALNSSVLGGRRHQTPKRRRSGRNGLSKKRRHTGK